ncbi:MAG: anhydro-N-acetylmuramic acid kinase [Planctomycetia bacterium]|nr:anhydro-N-acetylmuramic acid kinase [Planctomycetia bacterium]
MKTIADIAKKKTLRVAGLMSGTSADGVDAAIVDISHRGVKVKAFDTFAYLPALRRAVLDLCNTATARVDDICHYNFVLGEVFADAVVKLARKARIPLASIDLIGSHGQTIHHIPEGRRFGKTRVRSTLQIAESSVIAERTGITTVADFRPRDIAAGGEGAPLVPYADFLLFAHPRLNRAVQNIGGIANVTFLPANGGIGDIIAFDTGPGNMVMDRVVHLVSRGRHKFDPAGRMAAKGKVNEALLAELMGHRYFRRRPPKSTGREEFGREFAGALYARARKARIAPADILATVTALTARSIADAYRRFLPGAVDEVILCGGGARNRTLRKMLEQCVSPARVKTTGDFGIDADAKEAVSFAILAACTIRGTAGNVPAATGAKKSVVLGKIIPA